MIDGPSSTQDGAPGGASTHRLYARYDKQRVSHKTTTESEAVAAFAWAELQAQAAQLAAGGAVGIAWTENGRQRAYKPLSSEGGTP